MDKSFESPSKSPAEDKAKVSSVPNIIFTATTIPSRTPTESSSEGGSTLTSFYTHSYDKYKPAYLSRSLHDGIISFHYWPVEPSPGTKELALTEKRFDMNGMSTVQRSKAESEQLEDCHKKWCQKIIPIVVNKILGRREKMTDATRDKLREDGKVVFSQSWFCQVPEKFLGKDKQATDALNFHVSSKQILGRVVNPAKRTICFLRSKVNEQHQIIDDNVFECKKADDFSQYDWQCVLQAVCSIRVKAFLEANNDTSKLTIDAIVNGVLDPDLQIKDLKPQLENPEIEYDFVTLDIIGKYKPVSIPDDQSYEQVWHELPNGSVRTAYLNADFYRTSVKTGNARKRSIKITDFYAKDYFTYRRYWIDKYAFHQTLKPAGYDWSHHSERKAVYSRQHSLDGRDDKQIDVSSATPEVSKTGSGQSFTTATSTAGKSVPGQHQSSAKPTGNTKATAAKKSSTAPKGSDQSAPTTKPQPQSSTAPKGSDQSAPKESSATQTGKDAFDLKSVSHALSAEVKAQSSSTQAPPCDKNSIEGRQSEVKASAIPTVAPNSQLDKTKTPSGETSTPSAMPASKTVAAAAGEAQSGPTTPAPQSAKGGSAQQPAQSAANDEDKKTGEGRSASTAKDENKKAGEAQSGLTTPAPLSAKGGSVQKTQQQPAQSATKHSPVPTNATASETQQPAQSAAKGTPAPLSAKGGSVQKTQQQPVQSATKHPAPTNATASETQQLAQSATEGPPAPQSVQKTQQQTAQSATKRSPAPTNATASETQQLAQSATKGPPAPQSVQKTQHQPVQSATKHSPVPTNATASETPVPSATPVLAAQEGNIKKATPSPQSAAALNSDTTLCQVCSCEIIGMNAKECRLCNRFTHKLCQCQDEEAKDSCVLCQEFPYLLRNKRVDVSALTFYFGLSKQLQTRLITILQMGIYKPFESKEDLLEVIKKTKTYMKQTTQFNSLLNALDKKNQVAVLVCFGKELFRYHENRKVCPIQQFLVRSAVTDPTELYPEDSSWTNTFRGWELDFTAEAETAPLFAAAQWILGARHDADPSVLDFKQTPDSKMTPNQRTLPTNRVTTKRKLQLETDEADKTVHAKKKKQAKAKPTSATTAAAESQSASKSNMGKAKPTPATNKRSTPKYGLAAAAESQSASKSGKAKPTSATNKRSTPKSVPDAATNKRKAKADANANQPPPKKQKSKSGATDGEKGLVAVKEEIKQNEQEEKKGKKLIDKLQKYSENFASNYCTVMHGQSIATDMAKLEEPLETFQVLYKAAEKAGKKSSKLVQVGEALADSYGETKKIAGYCVKKMFSLMEEVIKLKAENAELLKIDLTKEKTDEEIAVEEVLENLKRSKKCSWFNMKTNNLGFNDRQHILYRDGLRKMRNDLENRMKSRIEAWITENDENKKNCWSKVQTDIGVSYFRSLCGVSEKYYPVVILEKTLKIYIETIGIIEKDEKGNPIEKDHPASTDLGYCLLKEVMNKYLCPIVRNTPNNTRSSRATRKACMAKVVDIGEIITPKDQALWVLAAVDVIKKKRGVVIHNMTKGERMEWRDEGKSVYETIFAKLTKYRNYQKRKKLEDKPFLTASRPEPGVDSADDDTQQPEYDDVGYEIGDTDAEAGDGDEVDSDGDGDAEHEF